MAGTSPTRHRDGFPFSGTPTDCGVCAYVTSCFNATCRLAVLSEKGTLVLEQWRIALDQQITVKYKCYRFVYNYPDTVTRLCGLHCVLFLTRLTQTPQSNKVMYYVVCCTLFQPASSLTHI